MMSNRTTCTSGGGARRWESGALAAGALVLLAATPALGAAAAPTPNVAASAATPAAAMAPVVPAPAPGISGDYLEARTADVYTGSCFANSEMDLAGKQAVVAWRVRQGGWQGVPLDGLAVVAAVRATATLGDPFGGPLRAAALIVVDQRATPVQRDALVAFARAMSGDLLAKVVGVESAPIEMAVGAAGGGRAPSPEAIAAAPHARRDRGSASHQSRHSLLVAAATPAAAHAAEQAVDHAADHAAERVGHQHLAAGQGAAGISGEARLKAGDWIDLATRGIGPQDHLCGNEEVFYPPLTAERSQVTAVPAVTVAYDFRGPGLGMVWSSPGKRSAFVGHFAGR